MERDRPLVYVPMAADTIHPGHMNILKIASGLGRVIVGLFSDEAIASYKRVPLMNYEQRKCVIENIKGVDEVVKQETPDYEPNLRLYHPAYMVHGTDWRTGPLANVRDQAIALMGEWGGQVVEPEYTTGISSTQLKKGMTGRGISPSQRQSALKKLLNAGGFAYVAGVCNAYSAALQSGIELSTPRQPKKEINALLVEHLPPVWAGDGAYSTELSRYLALVNEIASAVSLPLLVSDYPGITEHQLRHFLCEAQRLGASAVLLFDHPQEGALTMDEKLTCFRNENSASDFMAIPVLSHTVVDADSAHACTLLRKWVAGGAAAVCIDGSIKMTEGLSQLICGDGAIPGLPIFVAGDPELLPQGLRALGARGLVGRHLGAEAAKRCMQDASVAFLQTE